MIQVNDIVKHILLQLNIADRYQLDYLPKEDDTIKTILRCVNVIISEIASDYIAVRAQERVLPISSKIEYDTLGHRLINVKRVSNDKGSLIKYKMYPAYMYVESDSEVNIDYCYLPTAVGLGDEIALSPRVTELLLVNGTLGEYCLLEGRYEDSLIYDNRYREMLAIAIRPNRELKVKIKQ